MDPGEREERTIVAQWSENLDSAEKTVRRQLAEGQISVEEAGSRLHLIQVSRIGLPRSIGAGKQIPL